MNASAAEREHLLHLMHAALGALEQGDDTLYRSCIESLAQWRSRPIYAAIDRLARELTGALAKLPIDARLGALAGEELPDARARLSFVVQTTEEATHRTLDLVEDCRNRIDMLRSQGLDSAVENELMSVRSNLSSIALAQEYQDLTGQTIKRVVGLVQQVEQAIGKISHALGMPEQRRDTGIEAQGPALPGIDRHGVSQDDADDLLAGLGL
ncbi:MAG: protein phosphatase CheZ [Xanthomonadales bacterium]|jgi:chemotaxis protein CheZ|nr:protein phosphatase CheZ [Xanthomonadales bacterium]